MKRRDVIKLGAITTTAAIAPGCAVVPKPLAELSGASGAAEFNAMLDEQLAGLAKPGLLQKLVTGYTKRPMSAEKEAKLADKDAMFRRMMSTLLVSQGFRDLPPETQVQPSVQDRMWLHYDQIGGSVFEISDMLSNLDAKTRKAVRSKLKEDPELPMSIGEALHGSATKAGMSAKRKRQLRAMMSQAQFRLTTADPSVVIDEYVAKVDRHRASSERDADALDLARQIGEREFWRYQHLLAIVDDPNAAQTGGAQPGPAPTPVRAPAAPAPVPAPEGDPVARTLYQSAIRAARAGRCADVAAFGDKVKDIDPDFFRNVFAVNGEIVNCKPPSGAAQAPVQGPPSMHPVRQPPPQQQTAMIEEPKSKPGEKGIRAGGYMLGIGLIFGLVGLLLVAAEAFVGLFALTIAVLLFGIGLIVLFISAIIQATSDDD